MMFGSDFFKIMRFIMMALKLFATVFGDDEDRANGENDKMEI